MSKEFVRGLEHSPRRSEGRPTTFTKIYYVGHLVPGKLCLFLEKSFINQTSLGNLSKTVEDGDGNVGKTIKLITQDKKRT